MLQILQDKKEILQSSAGDDFMEILQALILVQSTDRVFGALNAQDKTTEIAKVKGAIDVLNELMRDIKAVKEQAKKKKKQAATDDYDDI